MIGLDGLFGAIGNVASSALAYKSQQQTNKSNQQMMREQMKWQEDMWNKNNEYNTPAEQVERMKAAGLNPVSTNMADGTSIDGAGSSGAPPGNYQLIPNQDPMQAAGNFARSFADASSLMQDAIYKRDTKRLRTAQLLAEIKETQKNATFLGLKGAEQEILNKYLDWQQQFDLSNKFANYHLTARQIRLAEKSEQQLTKIIEDFMPEELNKLIAEGKLRSYECDKILAELAKLKEEQANIHQDTELKKAQTTAADNQGSLLESQTELTDEQAIAQRNENRNYDKITALYISKLQEEVRKYAADADISEEQAWWVFYDKLEERSISLFGNKISYNRFGPESELFRNDVEHRYTEKGKRTYYPNR